MAENYIGEQIEVSPPVPADHPVLAEVNDREAIESNGQALWIRVDDTGQGVAIAPASPDGTYSVYTGSDATDVTAEVTKIVQAIGVDRTYTGHLYFEGEHATADEICQIHVRNGEGVIDQAQLMFPTDGLVLPREVIEDWTGGPITDGELFQIAEAAPWSSVPDGIATVVSAIRNGANRHKHQIFRTLDLSTMHLDPVHRDDLNGVAGVIADRREHGWFMCVPTDELDEQIADHEVPDDIAAIWRLAVNLDCQYVLFDDDAEIDESLDVY